MAQQQIRIRGAQQNNLKNIDLTLPHFQLIAVTGISGSGKSSLAFEVIAHEGRRQYLESIPSFARQFAGKITTPEVDEISGLFPVITLSQKTGVPQVGSTVGTLSELYDHLRLLYARFGTAPAHVALSRSLFSFNSPLGACPQCKGLGLEEKIDVEKLVADPTLSLRNGALVPTLPNGYIMYSQVTVDVLNTVCQQHGFDVDIPWQELTDDQRHVVLYGSDRIKVPFGKHSIESRLKWTGMKAKPREEGYYKGMMPIMQDILKRDRNKNILRFVTAQTCTACQGKRLNEAARSVHYHEQAITDLTTLSLQDLKAFFENRSPQHVAEQQLIDRLLSQLEHLCRLGCGHLMLAQPAASLTNGEIQRIRLVNQLSAELSHVLYVFDEPSIGLHPEHRQYLLQLFRTLVNRQNTVLLVEHDPALIRQADWVVEIGPKAGPNGGQLLFNGSIANFVTATPQTATQKALHDTYPYHSHSSASDMLAITIGQNTLHLDTQALNVITGAPSIHKMRWLSDHLFTHLEPYIAIDQSPIGRTPRSNPATYTGMADHIRDLFAALPDAKAKGFKKGRFSFNNKGGRCETCEGAGKIQLGMHYMGNVDLSCPTCDGKRFNAATLAITFRGKSIADVYSMRIGEAIPFFEHEPKILRYLHQLDTLGLDYLQLGQSSTTLSGGEAQRIKLATHLVKKLKTGTWFVLDEPTLGLHDQDVRLLISALHQLLSKGYHVLCVGYREQLIAAADYIIELGETPENPILFQGDGTAFSRSNTPTQRALQPAPSPTSTLLNSTESIRIEEASTHHLKNITVDFPMQQLTVVTGVSGSGKSSLVLDTLYAEAQSRFTESLSTYSRSYIRQSNRAKAQAFHQLTPVVAISRKSFSHSPRSTVGTLTGIYEKYRYLYSRVAQWQEQPLTARHFSFNHELGACPQCSGLGTQLMANANLMVKDQTSSILEGAFTANATIAYYGNPTGQFVAILNEVAKANGFDLDTPVKDYSQAVWDILLYGTGDQVWETEWEFQNKTRSGTQSLSMTWKGFANWINEEYTLKRNNKKTDGLLQIMSEKPCSSCQGDRLQLEALKVSIDGLNIAALARLNVEETQQWFESHCDNSPIGKLCQTVYDRIAPQLEALIRLDLGHITLDRQPKTLSGGEGQRVRLAQQLATGLTGMTYLLDEPTVGLHPNNVEQLLTYLFELRNKGNTIVVIEHNLDIIQAADHLIELGPLPGAKGGELIATGKAKDLVNQPASITGKYIDQSFAIPKVSNKGIPNAMGWKNINRYSLKGLDVHFSAQTTTAITGLSGAGKTTLLRDVIYPSLVHQHPMHCDSYYQNVTFDAIVEVDQKPMHTSATATVASHTGILQQLSALYAELPEAKAQGLKKSAFTYLHKDGKCSHCNGWGEVKISMDFMEDVWSVCDACYGHRFNANSSSILLDGKNIVELLQLDVESLKTQLQSIQNKKVKTITKLLDTLLEFDLGHLTLLQSTASLSGGEAQRLKLFSALQEKGHQQCLFLLDEPSAGLHVHDQLNLLRIFQNLIDAGHTVIYIEHSKVMIEGAGCILDIS